MSALKRQLIPSRRRTFGITRFSTGQLLITYVAEAAMPIFVIGLYVVQLPRIGRMGLLGAIGYAYAFIYFTGTVLFALVTGASDFSSLEDDLGV